MKTGEEKKNETNNRFRSLFRDLKQNKGTILRASVDYIRILRRQYDNSGLIEEKCQQLTEENVALHERVKVRRVISVLLLLSGNLSRLGIGTEMPLARNCHSAVGQSSYSNGERRTVVAVVIVEQQSHRPSIHSDFNCFRFVSAIRLPVDVRAGRRGQ